MKKITGTIPKQTSKSGAIKQKKKNAGITVEGGDEAITAVWNEKELTTHPLFY